MLGDGPAWVDVAWWEGYGPALRDRQLARGQWVDALAKAWCLVRIRESLTPRQASDQDDYVDRLLGLKFYPTQPKSVEFVRTDEHGRRIADIDAAGFPDRL